jgi:hypothetical protein
MEGYGKDVLTISLNKTGKLLRAIRRATTVSPASGAAETRARPKPREEPVMN